MNQPGTSPKPRILVSPLDWGLGHATRSVPLVRALQSLGCQVFLAGEGQVKDLLQREFPTLPFLHLKGYHIRYSKNKWSLPLVIAAQIPKILSIIQYEKERLKEMVKEHSLNAVISDNRFGLYHPGIPSVFITHQLRIKLPFGPEQWLQQMNYSYINRFSECWVPDLPGDLNLGGALSHPMVKPRVPVKYLGALSRLSATQTPVKGKHLLVLLSGPEPQRTMLEKVLLEQLKNYKAPVIMLRGLPGSTSLIEAPPHVQLYNHLDAEQLSTRMSEASFVISRCGYSTVMDLAQMKAKSILIPTPGQTEQEYLSKHLMSQGFALCIPQDKFQLLPALDLAARFPYREMASVTNTMDVLKDFVSGLKC